MVLGCGDDGENAATLDDDAAGSESVSSSSTTPTNDDSSGAGTVSATTSVTEATTSVDTSSSGGSSDESPSFDVGTQSDIGVSRRTCSAVDFLFVIDDSSSMDPHQANLIANFPAFIAGIESTLVDVETYQVGIITTDPYAGNPGACILLGALVTGTAGTNSSNMDCVPYAEGFNYMTQEDDLADKFSCAAQVGTNGSGSERPMEAMVNAVSKTVGACNEGFLRDEALLVIVVITDEYDGRDDPEPGNGREPPTSTGTPQSWYDAVIAAKNDIPENAAALAIVNYEGGSCPPAELGFDGVNIVEWVSLFGTNGFLGGICEEDYGPFFDDATDVIAEACANFVPEG
jgi:hypothetical protein